MNETALWKKKKKNYVYAILFNEKLIEAATVEPFYRFFSNWGR